MTKGKIGYLPLYIKLYDDSDIAIREPLVKYMHTLTGMLESQGLTLVKADVCRVKDEFDAALRLFKSENVIAIVTQHLAYSPSLESIEALKRAGVPIIIMDTTPDYMLNEAQGYMNGIMSNHGIHGVQDMCNMLRRNGVAYSICAGHAMHSEVISEVAGLCRAAAVAYNYRTARVGSVGGSFIGMGDFLVSDSEYKDKIGAEVMYMDHSAVKTYLEKVTDTAVDEEIAIDKAQYTYEISDEQAYRDAVKSGLAIRYWAEDNTLTALTVNFLTLDICSLPKMPFVECSKAMQRGLGYAGEGDVLTAGLTGALRAVYPDTSFVEMFCPDWKENIVLISHMGEMNLNLAQWKPVLCTVPFNYNSCGDTAAAYACYRPGSAVLINVAPSKDGFSLIASKVEMLGCGLQNGAYRNTIQGWLKPCKPLPEFLKEYSELGGTHHSAMVYGVDINEILAFGRMMGFEVHEIESVL